MQFRTLLRSLEPIVSWTLQSKPWVFLHRSRKPETQTMPKTIRLDCFRYITNEGWRALVSIEMGLKNHEVVPVDLIQKISRCRKNTSGFTRLIKDQLMANGLVAYEVDSKKSIRGYRLTNLGYDYLALHQFFRAGVLRDLGAMIGTGKESDVYMGFAGEACGAAEHGESGCTTYRVAYGESVVVKFHRLGRTSFRKVKEKREYHQHRGACSWLYLDRLASQREYTMMQALHSHGLPVPSPLAHNRNAVVMSYVEKSLPLSRVLPKVLKWNNAVIAHKLYYQAVKMLCQISSIGLVHGDFNEFNLMVTGLDEIDVDLAEETSSSNVRLVLIDFPQMISRDHDSAESIYARDADGIVSFFSKFFDIPEADLPPQSLSSIERVNYIDVVVRAPGYPSKHSEQRKARRTLEHALIGATASLNLSSGDSSPDDDENEERCRSATSSTEEDNGDHGVDSTDDSSELTSTVDSVPATEEGGLSLRSVDTGSRKTKQKPQPASDRPMSQDEVRARQFRERRRQEQRNFQMKVKRNARATLKCEGRASLKAELTLFG